jgi:hypothetical protein
MVYKDYELAPSNRVLEKRNSGFLFDKRMNSVSGKSPLSYAYYNIILLGSFSYFLRKFYVPKNLYNNLFSILSAGIISFSLASKYEHSALLFLGDVNEYRYLHQKGMQYYFKKAESAQNNHSVTLYS